MTDRLRKKAEKQRYGESTLEEMVHKIKTLKKDLGGGNRNEVRKTNNESPLL